MIIFFFAIVVILLIVSINGYIENYNIDKEKAYKDIPVYKEYVKIPSEEIKNDSKKLEFFNKFYFFVNKYKNLEHIKKTIPQLEDSIKISIKRKFDNLEYLTNRLSSEKTRLVKLKNFISNYDSGYGNKDLFSKIRSEYKDDKILYTKSEVVNLFLKDSVFTLETSKFILIYVEELIIFLNQYTLELSIFKSSEIKSQIKMTQIEKTIISKNDEILSKRWFKAKKDGTRDLRYSNNYYIYTINKYNFIFDMSIKYSIEFNNREDSIRFNNMIHSNIKSSLEESRIKKINIVEEKDKFIYTSLYGYAEVIRKINNNEIEVKLLTNKSYIKINILKTPILYVKEFEINNYKKTQDIIINSGSSINLFTKKNTNSNHSVNYVYHSSLGIGKIIDTKGEVNLIDFIDQENIKSIVRTFPLSYLTKNEVEQKIIEKYLVNKYIYINGEFGQIIRFDRINLIARTKNDRIIKSNYIFDLNMTKVYFSFKIINKEEYFSGNLGNSKKEILENNIKEVPQKTNNNFIKQEYGYKIRKDIINKDLVSDEIVKGNYVIHPYFEEGIVLDTSESVLTIDFYNFGIKKIERNYLGLSIINKPKTNKKLTSANSEIINDVAKVGDIIEIPNFGKCLLIDSTERDIEITCSDRKNRKFVKSLLIDQIRKPLKNDKFSYDINPGDYLKNELLGYCKVLTTSEEGIDILIISDTTVYFYSNKELFYFDKVSKNEEYNLNYYYNRKQIFYKNEIATLVNISKFDLSITSTNFNDLVKVSEIDLSNHNIDKWINSNMKYSEDIKDIISYINKDYYIKDEMSSKISKNPNIKKMIGLSNFNKLKGLSNIYLSNRYINLERYVFLESLKSDIYFYNYDFDSDNYRYVLDRLQKKQLIFKIFEEKYFTLNKLSQQNLTTKDIEEFNSRIIDFLNKNKFLSLENVRKVIKSSIYKMFFEDSMLSNLIRSFTGIRTYVFGNKTTFVLTGSDNRSDFFENTIIEISNLKKEKSKDVYDLIFEINEKYDFNFDIGLFVKETKNFKKIYYDEEMEKIYLEKEYYYEEVYK